MNNIPHVDEIHTVYSGQEFANILKNASACYNHVYLWAHNGGKFDHHNVYPWLATNKDEIKNLSYFDLKLSQNKYIHFRDTMKFFPGPLANLGLRVNSPKHDMHFSKCIPENLDILLPYCRQDVNILYLGFQWLQEHVIPIIAPNTSIFAFCSLPDMGWYKCCQYITVPTYKFHNYADFQIFKDCFKGGRVFSNMWGQTRQKLMACIDVRSMYPIALTGDLPYGDLRGPFSNIPPNKRYIAIASLIKPQQKCIDSQQPLLPVRLAKGGIGYIDSGSLTDWFTDVDIQSMQNDGWKLIDIQQVYYWPNSAPYLRDNFINGYKERIKSTKGSGTNLAWKLLLNSAYGKFSQYKVGSAESILNREHYIGWYCLAYSRRILYLLKQYIKGPCYYGDTDSIYIDLQEALTLKKDHPELFVDELADIMKNEIRLDLEQELCELTVIGKKAYGGIRTDGTTFVKFKGQPDVKYEQLINVLHGKTEFSTYKTLDSHYSCAGICGLGEIKPRERTINCIIPEYYSYCTHCNYYYAVGINA